MNTKNWIVAFVVVILILLSVFVWKRDQNSNQSNNSEQVLTDTTATSTKTTTNNELPVGVTIIPGTNITLTQPQPQKVNLPEPDLNRPIPENSSFDATTVAALKVSLATTIANLQKNNTSFTDWIDLGFYRKALGDYQGAALAWEYVSLLYPKNSVSFGNLGDLYANFLGEPNQAITDYTQAITNDPANVNMYSDLATIYESTQNSSAAIAILKQGIRANPNNTTLQAALTEYQATLK